MDLLQKGNQFDGSSGTDMPVVQAAPAQYAKVEMMGHRVVYGLVAEVPFAGTNMLRIETMTLPEEPETVESRGVSDYTDADYVDNDYDYGNGRLRRGAKEKLGDWVRPAIPAEDSVVSMVGGSSIYCLTFITRDECLNQSMLRRPRPGSVFVPRAQTVPAIEAAPAHAELIPFGIGDLVRYTGEDRRFYKLTGTVNKVELPVDGGEVMVHVTFDKEPYAGASRYQEFKKTELENLSATDSLPKDMDDE